MCEPEGLLVDLGPARFAGTATAGADTSVASASSSVAPAMSALATSRGRQRRGRARGYAGRFVADLLEARRSGPQAHLDETGAVLEGP
jgi:hypothetical protein